jgi:hypothetical protein
MPHFDVQLSVLLTSTGWCICNWISDWTPLWQVMLSSWVRWCQVVPTLVCQRSPQWCNHSGIWEQSKDLSGWLEMVSDFAFTHLLSWVKFCFMCYKYTTWVPLLYFCLGWKLCYWLLLPLKICWPCLGLNLGSRGKHVTTRPSRRTFFLCENLNRNILGGCCRKLTLVPQLSRSPILTLLEFYFYCCFKVCVC